MLCPCSWPHFHLLDFLHDTLAASCSRSSLELPMEDEHMTQSQEKMGKENNPSLYVECLQSNELPSGCSTDVSTRTITISDVNIIKKSKQRGLEPSKPSASSGVNREADSSLLNYDDFICIDDTYEFTLSIHHCCPCKKMVDISQSK